MIIPGQSERLSGRIEYCCMFLHSPGWVLSNGLVVDDGMVKSPFFCDLIEALFSLTRTMKS